MFYLAHPDADDMTGASYYLQNNDPKYAAWACPVLDPDVAELADPTKNLAQIKVAIETLIARHIGPVAELKTNDVHRIRVMVMGMPFKTTPSFVELNLTTPSRPELKDHSVI